MILMIRRLYIPAEVSVPKTCRLHRVEPWGQVTGCGTRFNRKVTGARAAHQGFPKSHRGTQKMGGSFHGKSHANPKKTNGGFCGISPMDWKPPCQQDG